jgi:hypothetical protein
MHPFIEIMKQLRLFILLSALTLCVVAADSNLGTNRITGRVAERVTIKCPSDLRANGAKGATPYSLDFVLDFNADFRLLYCDYETLQKRIADQVCIIDFDSPEPFCREIKVTVDSTLGDVFKKSGARNLEKYKGFGQPPIRIINSHAILAPEGGEKFLKTKISAGDFIVVQPVD